MSQTDGALLEVRGICKQFPGVVALDNVNLTLNHAEVLAVIGENGAGKSTLMKILAGVEHPGAGEIRIEGRPVNVDSVTRATELGIALIHQELNLHDNLDIGANVFLGREPRWSSFLPLIDFPTLYRETETILRRLGLDCSPRTLVRNLPVAQQQMVEIAKALSVNARILIMDEPTSSLSQHETEQLFHVIRDLKTQGVSVVYISHRLGEVKEIADRVLALRDGKNAGELAREEINHDHMVKLMVGRDLVQFYVHTPHDPGKTVLEVERLVTPAHPAHEISFTLRTGEIVGLAGLVGAGRTELARVLFGVERPLAGRVRLNGAEIHLSSPREAIQAGLALVPEDRKQQGLILEMAVRENISLAALDRYQTASLIRRDEEWQLAQRLTGQLRIRTPSIEQEVQYLSGGNQQKVILAKWLSLRPLVLILDEPTRGLDVGAKREIYGLMEELAKEGVAILMISSELQEILGMSDRVLVMHEGRLAGELPRDRLSEESIMHLATGAAA
ncbi:MAG TPA: sugar ABC transporter ATP-binding protein [bacterium]|nr:sugar ABC transporter ATP-binding protein [bacterium]